MLATALTLTLQGIEARPLRVEVDVHRGPPGFSIVGLPDAAAMECRERVRAALTNTGFEFPLSRVLVNLAPAELRKAAPGMDLAIAAALLCASGQLEWDGLPETPLIGELALDGSVRPVDGTLQMVEAARAEGAEAIIVPADNGPEAALVEGIEVIPLQSVSQLARLAQGWRPPRPKPLALQEEPPLHAPDIADLRGQPQLRRSLEVAAAGGHSLLLLGPPGAGRSLAASRLPSILPAPSHAEALEVARISSVCGRLSGPRHAARPFRSPHYTIGTAGLLGTVKPPRPGDLAGAGITVISDLSFGIGACVHRGALDAGRTIAVLGCGPDSAFPGAHRSLWRRICEEGLVLAELPPGAPPWRWTAPARSRIIAALAGMTVVVEAATGSPSLFTAEIASDLGRDLGAVPGPVTSRASEGTNNLLAAGACVVREAQDVLDAAFGPGVRKVAHTGPPLDADLAAVLALVERGVNTCDDLAAQLRRTPAEVSGCPVPARDSRLPHRSRP